MTADNPPDEAALARAAALTLLNNAAEKSTERKQVMSNQSDRVVGFLNGHQRRNR
jgi:hypothetical protein